jgi:hypothetical protein
VIHAALYIGQKYVTLACGKISIYSDENSMCGLHGSKNIYLILPEAVAGKKKKTFYLYMPNIRI